LGQQMTRIIQIAINLFV